MACDGNTWGGAAERHVWTTTVRPVNLKPLGDRPLEKQVIVFCMHSVNLTELSDGSWWASGSVAGVTVGTGGASPDEALAAWERIMAGQ